MARLSARVARAARRRQIAAVAVTVALGAGLAACGNQGTDLARQACSHVTRSLSLLHKAQHEQDPARAAVLDHQAYAELLAALPIAAEAAYHDEQYQALMTTLSQSSQVGEAKLASALTSECAIAESSPFNQAPPPSKVPPPAPAST